MSDELRRGKSVQDAHDDDRKGSEASTDLSRRKFAKIGVVAAPLVSSLFSRPVLGAYQCTVSGMLSGNLSNHDPNVTCYSKSEGVWKSQSVLGPQAQDGTYPNHYWPFPYTPETRFHDYFSTLVYNYGDATFIQVMNASNDLGISNDHNVGFKAVGALLNARYFGEESFGYSDLAVIDFWNAWNSTVYDLAEFMSALNHRWDSTSPKPKF